MNNQVYSDDIFTPAISLKHYENKVFEKAINFASNNSDIDLDEAALVLAKCLGIINIFHPFPEGNGRTQRMFISLLAIKRGFEVDWNSAFAWEMLECCKAVHRQNYQPMISLIT